MLWCELDLNEGPKIESTIFGLTEAQITEYTLAYGLPALIVFMLFIIANLAWKSKAGKFGTLVLFMGLAVGMLGFSLKYIIQWFLTH